jgi:2-methylcitrate dehydratase PrpD
MTSDAIATLCRHAVSTRDEAIPPAALQAARIFLLDSLGVGVAGSTGPFVDELCAAHAGLPEARVLGRRDALPAAGAALVSAYQIHNGEFDCIHEAAVVHPMAVLLGAVLAWLDRRAQRGEPPTAGRELLAALVLGVDTACHVGVASRSPLRFFRPATAGSLAATAAIGRLSGFDSERLVNAMGINLGQMCGTMQAHSEGSAVLAMQAGFNARNALVACDLAARGVPGPQQVLEGTFGYFALFEGEYDLAGALAHLGRRWRICEVAHKPFPSGRATHGIIDACLQLAREHGFSAADVARVSARVPPLTHRLVGRPPHADMQVNYARLCGAYAGACALLAGTVGLDDFSPAALRDPVRLALAARIEVIADGNTDPNAFTPISVRVHLHGGARVSRTLDVVYGNPARAMDRAAQLAKFRANCRASAVALDDDAAERAIALVDGLDEVGDVRALLACLTPR